MADNISKVFQLTEGLNCEKIGEGILKYLRIRQNLVAEGAVIPEGYFIQAKSEDTGWTKIAGMGKAIQVRILNSGGKLITVSVGNGQWSDKIGAGVAGAFIFAPLALTAALGAWNQKRLADNIFDFTKEFITTGGKNMEVMEFESMGMIDINSDEIECPKCKRRNPKTNKFCSGCGSPLSDKCPKCGKPVPFGNKFCPECGSPMKISKKCPKCGAELSDKQKFCPECGTPVK